MKQVKPFLGIAVLSVVAYVLLVMLWARLENQAACGDSSTGPCGYWHQVLFYLPAAPIFLIYLSPLVALVGLYLLIYYGVKKLRGRTKTGRGN